MNNFELCSNCKGYTKMIGVRADSRKSYFSIGRVCFNCRTIDITNESFIVKPKLYPHDHKESNCKVCRDYINKLDKYRQSITGGDVKNKKLLSLSQTSDSKVAKLGKRKFDLPKPVLARPLTLS